MTWGVPASGGAPTGYYAARTAGAGGPIVPTIPLGNQLSFDVNAPNGDYFLSVRPPTPPEPGPSRTSCR